jgi:hypothetical protein
MDGAMAGLTCIVDVRGPLGVPSLMSLLLRGFGSRGGTRRLKLATTSGGELRLSVGCDHVLASGSSMAGSMLRRLTFLMKP